MSLQNFSFLAGLEGTEKFVCGLGGGVGSKVLLCLTQRSCFWVALSWVELRWVLTTFHILGTLHWAQVNKHWITTYYTLALITLKFQTRMSNHGCSDHDLFSVRYGKMILSGLKFFFRTARRHTVNCPALVNFGDIPLPPSRHRPLSHPLHLLVKAVQVLA